MRKFIGIFKQAWLISLLGLLAIAALIYFLGPFLDFMGIKPMESPINRYIAIAVLFLLWVLWQVWKAWQANMKNQQMLNHLVDSTTPKLSPEELASQEEITQLSERLQDALQSLEKSRLATGGDTHLYQLPWYIIIGSPGAGKTTLLANSSLHFPLSDKYGRDAVRGVGGTRNCDWWFTDDAILLDTAGRYTTQDSQKSVDQTAWLGFLGLLKQYRGRQPLNGVLVAVSLADFFRQGAEAQAQQAKVIRQRIQELHEHLGIRLPVYMLFTKADLLAGFTEFFDDLDKDGREQVWGMTFPHVETTDQSAEELFTPEFALLDEQLQRQLLGKLDKERSAERRRALYLFPQQFSALKESVQKFLSAVFQPSRYEQTVLLRGVYFTSATQEGAPIDCIMASLANSFGVRPQQISRFSAQGKSFFINQLLSKVVFQESGLAGINLKLERKLQWMRSFAVVGAGMVLMALILLWTVSYFHNRAFQQQYGEKVASLTSKMALVSSSDGSSALNVLEEVRQLTWSYRDKNKAETIPLFARFGLSQAKTLGEAMDDKYETLLKASVVPYARQLLETQIQASLNRPDKTDDLLVVLKNYLFLGDVAKPKDAKVSGVQSIDWNNNGQSGDAVDKKIAVHMQVILEKSHSSAIDPKLVEAARQSLHAADPSRLAYARFKLMGLEQAEQYAFMVKDKADLQDVDQAFRRVSRKPWTDNVPGFFTKAGYEKVFLPQYKEAAKDLTSEAWVLGPNVDRLKDSQQIAKEFENFYQTDYIAAWNGFLTDIEPLPVKNIPSAKAMLQVLTSNGGNILFRLMQEVQQETDFSPDAEQKNVFGLSVRTPVTPLLMVDNAFKKIHEWTNEARFKPVSDLLDEVYGSIDQKDLSGQPQNTSLSSALVKLEGEANKLPPAFGVILQKMVQLIHGQVNGVIQQEVRDKLNEALQDTVGSFCQQQLAGYPLVAKSKQGVNLADFTEFFSQGGRVDQFRTQQLQPSKADSATLQQVKNQLTVADTVRKAFFQRGALGFNYSIKLVNLSPELHSLEVSTGAQTQTFKLGESKTFAWPDGQLVQVIAIPTPAETEAAAIDREAGSTLPTGADEPKILASENGDDWLIFRLFESKKWNIADKAVLQLVPLSSPDPFQVAKTELRRFKCPTL